MSAGKGDKPRPHSKARYDEGFDAIQWMSKKRRGGRPGQVIENKRKYNRKRKHKGQYGESEAL